MAFTVTAYTYSKKINSTSRPSGGTNFNGVLKQECDILSPVISFTQNMIPYNYYYIPSFNRYYFVTGVKNVENLWEVSMKIDPLASWRSEIGAQTLYVERCASLVDGKILDTLYPAISETDYETEIDTTFWKTSLDDGTYIVGVTSDSTTYYTFTKSALDLFLGFILSESYTTAVLDELNILAVYPQYALQVNALQFITSIMWMPFSVGGGDPGITPITSLKVGFIDVPVSAGKIDGSSVVFFSNTFTPPNHPQYIRGSYLNNAPYSSYSIFYPPFGQIELDPNLVANSNELECLVAVDLRTGDGTLNIIDNTNSVITSWTHAKIGVNYQVSQVLNASGFGVAQTLTTGSSVALNALSGNYAGAGVNTLNGVLGGIESHARAKIPSAKTLGSNGGLNALRGNPTLFSEFKKVVDDDPINRGTPICKELLISSLSGFILVSNANISIPASETEINEIRQYMEGGFFYE